MAKLNPWFTTPGEVDETHWPNDSAYRAMQFNVINIDSDLSKNQETLITLRIRVKAADAWMLNFFTRDSVGYMIPRDVVSGNVKAEGHGF